MRLFLFARKAFEPAVVIAVLCLPLGLWPFIPGTDWPIHIATAKILGQLITHPDMPSAYALNLQPVPYYGFYLLTVPLQLAFGPLVGAKVAVGILAAATALGWEALRQKLYRPSFTLWLVLPVFWGFSFFYGFAVSLCGLPLAIFAIERLLGLQTDSQQKEIKRRALQAGLLAACAIGCHLWWAAPMLTACVVLGGHASMRTYLLSSDRQRNTLSDALPWMHMLAAGVAVLPVLAWRVLSTAQAAGSFKLHYGSIDAGFAQWGRSTFALIDDGAARLGFWLLLTLPWVIRLHRRWRAHRAKHPSKPWFETWTAMPAWAWLALAWVGLAVAIPTQFSTPGAEAWGIPLRLFAPIIGLVSLGCVLPTAQHQASPWGAWAMRCAGVVFAGGVFLFWHQFNLQVAQGNRALQTMQASDALYVDWGKLKQQHVGDAWPPVARHQHAYSVVFGAAFDDGLFVAHHAPIQIVQPQPKATHTWALGMLTLQDDRDADIGSTSPRSIPPAQPRQEMRQSPQEKADQPQ